MCPSLACLSLALCLGVSQPPPPEESRREPARTRVAVPVPGAGESSQGDLYMVVSHADTSRFNQATLEGLVREMNSWAARGWEFVDVKIVPVRPSTYHPERYTLRSVHPDAVAYLLKRRPRL